MITEDYVSFEVAKLLKEKGFDERVTSFYTESGLEGYMFALKTTKNTELNSEFVSRPTLQMAMKWLREVHNINIEIITYWTKDKSMVYGNRMVHNNVVFKEIDIAYNSYEQACETAIKYCLENLI